MLTAIRNKYMTHKPILYIDMDGVLVPFEDFPDEIVDAPGFFENLKPTKDAIPAVEWLIQHFECFILTTTPWNAPHASAEKRRWIEQHLPPYFYKRLITSHFKNLNIGDYLIDDRATNGAAEFSGQWIQFGSTEFPNWQVIIDYLARRINASSILLSL